MLCMYARIASSEKIRSVVFLSAYLWDCFPYVWRLRSRISIARRIHELGNRSFVLSQLSSVSLEIQYDFRYCSSVQYYCTSCWIVLPECSGFPRTAFRYCTTVLQQYTSFLLTLPSAYLGNCFLWILHYMHHSSITPARMRVDCGSWIQWLASRTRSCADNLGGGWEREEAP